MISQHDLMKLLRSLGITPCYAGFDCLLCAIALVQHDPSCLTRVVHDVYQPVARSFSLDWRNMEHNIRTLTHKAWDTDKVLLCEIAGYPLDASPSVSKFIEMLAFYPLRSSSSVCFGKDPK